MGKIRRGGYVVLTWSSRVVELITTLEREGRCEAAGCQGEQPQASPRARDALRTRAARSVHEARAAPDAGGSDRRGLGRPRAWQRGRHLPPRLRREGSVHVEHALEYNRDPGYVADVLVHRLTVEAAKRVAGGWSQPARARATPRDVRPQIYRVLDPANTRKSFAQLVALLDVLDCEVRVSVRRSTAASHRAGRDRQSA